MKKLIFFCSVLALGTSKPNGFFHQEYSYKSSSSSYKNNELQHKKDDAGFYSKDGDLEGRVKPKVNSESQHSEYTNPKLLSGSGTYQSGGYGAGNSANYMAGSDRLFGGVSGLQSAGAVDGFASSDRVLDLSNAYSRRGYTHGQGYGANQGYSTLQGGAYGGSGSNYDYTNGGSSNNYGYTQGGSSYGYMQQGSSQATSGSYATNANLNSLMQRLQDDMTRQLENAVYRQHQSTGYTTSVSNTQMNADIRLLEDEIRRNLTRQLQDSLRTQYGTTSYTTVEGRPSTVPDYSTQELAALTRRLENDLISKLHQSVRTTYNRETSNSYGATVTYRPVYTSTLRPYYDVVTPYQHQENIPYPGRLIIGSQTHTRYTPVPNPESLTQIASKIQSEVNSNLDIALQNLYSTYLQTGRSSYYTISDFDNEVNRIRDEIIRNLTYNLDDQIRRNYGQQVLKNDYYYTMSSNGDISTQSNYNLRDYENLKKQVEENLLRKLNQTVNTYRDQYQRYQSQYQQSTSNSYAVTYRPVYYTSGNQLYDYSDLQRQLSAQLQSALDKHRYSQSSSYTSSSSYNPQAFQASMDELSRELQRNLTEQLGSYRASSGSSSSYGYSSGGGSADFESMKNQLQNQLMQQLRQGLQNQYHYSASASYSASSSSSANANYGMRHGYRRRRRDLNNYNPEGRRHGIKSIRRRFFSSQTASDDDSQRFLHHPEDLSYPQVQKQTSYSSHYTHHSSNYHSTQVDPDIVEDLGILEHPTTKKINTDQLEDNLQQLEELPNKHKIQYAKQNELTQQLEETQPLQSVQDDLTQQLEFGHRTTHKITKLSGKLEDQNDLSQRLEVEAPIHHRILKQERYFRRYNQGQVNLDQENLGQQLEDQNLVGHLQDPKNFYQEPNGQMTIDYAHLPRQETQSQLNLDQQTLGQQLEDQNLVGHLQRPKNYDQEPNGQLTIGYVHSPRQETQNQLNLDQQILGQQLEDQNLIGSLQVPKNYDQEPNGQLTIGFAHLPRQETQSILNLDQQTLGQQLEDQNLVGHLQRPKNHDQEPNGQLTIGYAHLPRQETQGQLNLDQQTLGQQLEDQNLVGQLQGPKNYDQEPNGQLTIGNAHLPRQETESQLNLDQQTLGQQLEDQNLVGQLQSPKNYDQEPNGQLSIGQQLEDQNLVGQKPDDQELEGQLSLGRPKNRVQNVVGQLHLEPQTLGQQLEDQNFIGSLQTPKIGDDQNELDLTQQLEIEDTRKPKLVQVQQEESLPTQQLELGNIRKPKNSDQQLQEPSGDYEQQQTDGEIAQQSQEQQLEFGKPKNKKPAGVVLKPQEQSEDDLQQLELERKPQFNQKVQQVNDDLTQQLEMENPKSRKPISDQQLQNQEDLDSQLVLQPSQKAINQVADDLTQQLEDLQKPKYQKPSTQLVNQDQQNIENESVGLLQGSIKLETTTTEQKQEDQQLTDQNVEDLGQKLEEPDQKLEEPDQQLELDSLNQNKVPSQSSSGNQKTEEGLNLMFGQKPKNNFAEQKGQQVENDFSLNIPTLESQLSFVPESKQPESELIGHHKVDISNYHPFGQTERNLRHHSFEHNFVGQSEQYPKTFGSYGGPGSYRQGSIERSFTKGHSGYFTGETFPSLGSQARVDTYENALKQQDALLDLLKKKVHDSQSSNQNLYGQRTIKKTVFVNGKAVDTQESSQLIKPNGEIVDVGSSSPFQNIPSKSIESQFGTHFSTSGYSGNTFRTNYHIGDPRMYTGGIQSFTHRNSFGENPFSQFGDGFGRNAQSEFSGKTTKRVVHYVNGKPVSASEKIQIRKPNGEIIENNRNLPTDELSNFTHGVLNTQFGPNEFNSPQTNMNSQISKVSTHTIQRTSHYVNGKLVDSSSNSQDLGPNDVSEIENNPQAPQSVYTSGIKTTRHFGN